MLTFLIMAGGSGERFWPLSTKSNPKQLLKIFNEKSLIRLTYERILPLVDKDQIFIATNAIQAELIKKEIPELREDRIIIEPLFKDTAAAIAYGSTIINKYYKNPEIAVLASDHLIAFEDEFRNVIKIARKEALNNNIVTLGIKPEYPETGYGYIMVESSKLNTPTKSLGFREKPNYETAKKYVESKSYLWNSGMFIFKYDIIMEALKMYALGHYNIIKKIDSLINENNGVITANIVKDLFEGFEKKSIDYAVMEHAKNIMVIPSSFGWNDVGGYLAFEELFDGDENGNVIRNVNVLSVDSNNNIIVSDSNVQRVSLLGVSNMIVSVTKYEILVCNKNNNQDIKKILKLI